ncbi:hypothetical protein QI442_15180, partial [Staphylococcus aureus]|nr:hypothetical protein [Staphylococcus aureus]
HREQQPITTTLELVDIIKEGIPAKARRKGVLPQTDIELSEADQVTFEKLIDALEDLEDVQNVFHNVDLK